MRAVLWVALAACETGGGGGGTSIDAAVDAAVPVTALPSCPSIVATTVTDSSMSFIPKDSTIARGQVVKFVITAEHFVLPNTLVNTDPALMVNRGQTKCSDLTFPRPTAFCAVRTASPGRSWSRRDHSIRARSIALPCVK